MTTGRYYIKSHAAAEQRVDSSDACSARASRHPDIVAERRRRVEIYARRVAAGEPITPIPQTRPAAAEELT